jgi:hypothetical protein
MKNTEAHPESASGRLAAYFESHKDAMTNEWVAREALVLFCLARAIRSRIAVEFSSGRSLETSRYSTAGTSI